MTMRNLLTILFCSVAISWHATASDEVGNGMIEKGAHGVMNISTCWIELPNATECLGKIPEQGITP